MPHYVKEDRKVEAFMAKCRDELNDHGISAPKDVFSFGDSNAKLSDDLLKLAL